MFKLEMDLSELCDYQKKLAGFEFEDIIRRIALEFIRKVKKNTPVDTGNLRRNWQVGDVISDGKFYDVEISNEVFYAEYVELGHRLLRNGLTIKWVNGRFMLRLSERQIMEALPDIVDRALRGNLKA